jgi:hypothetical protein
MRGIGAALAGLQSLGLPHWAVGLVFFLGLFTVIAQVMKGGPAARARGLIKRASVQPAPIRTQMERAALELVQDDPNGLLGMAQEAVERGSQATARLALERVLELGKHSDVARRMLDGLGDRPTLRLESELIAIRNLLDEGLTGMARDRLARARSHWPQAEALDELEQRLREEA